MNFNIKHLAIIPALVMIIATIMGASAVSTTYDFESCGTLAACNLTESGFHAGLGESYITDFGGSSVLWYSPSPTTSTDRAVLSFDNLPVNVTVLEFDAYPTNTAYGEWSFNFGANTTLVQDEPATKLRFYHTYYTSRGVSITYDFNGIEGTGHSYNTMALNSWNHIKLVLNHTTQKFSVWKNDVFVNELDWSDHAGDVGNLGELAFLRNPSNNADPSTYLDNIVFTSVEPAVPNLPPVFDSFSPLDYDVVAPYNGGQMFSVVVSDPENDSLSYQWYLDGVSLFQETYDVWTLVGLDRGVGTYNVSVVVSDGEFDIVHSWNATVLPKEDESGGSTRYVVDAAGTVVGVQSNGQVLMIPTAEKKAGFASFDFGAWFNSIIDFIKGVFQ